MDDSKARKTKRRLEVSRARQTSKKSKRKQPVSVSSESSDSSSYDYCHRRKKNSKRKKVQRSGNGRSMAAASNDRKHKRHPHKEGRRKKERNESPIRCRLAGSKRRCRSISGSESRNSGIYSSDTCSPCYSNESRGRRLKKRRFDSSKKSSRHRGFSKEVDNKRSNKEKVNLYKNVVDELAFENSSGNIGDSYKAVSSHCPEKDRKRSSAGERLRDSFSIDAHACRQEDDTSKLYSFIAKSNVEEGMCDDSVSKAEAFELLLRNKALENLRKFRGFQFGKTQVSSSYKVEQSLFLDSRDINGAENETCGTEEPKRYLEEPTDRLPTEHPRDRRDYQQPIKQNASSQKENIKVGLQMDLVTMEPFCHGNTSILPMCPSQRPTVSELHGVCEVGMSGLDSSGTNSLHNNDNNPAEVGDKDLNMAPMNSNKECPYEPDAVKLEQPAVQASQVKAIKEISGDDVSPAVMPTLDGTTKQKSEDSTFQRKTMSVRRGGEMVQVSYKVYIPQRSSALARRQLR